MVEYCWQAKYLEGGLIEVMETKRKALEAIFAKSDNDPWQMSALPLTASPNHLEECGIPKCIYVRSKDYAKVKDSEDSELVCIAD